MAHSNKSSKTLGGGGGTHAHFSSTNSNTHKQGSVLNSSYGSVNKSGGVGVADRFDTVESIDVYGETEHGGGKRLESMMSTSIHPSKKKSSNTSSQAQFLMQGGRDRKSTGDFLFKVIILGDSKVGKSAIIMRLVVITST